MNIPTPFRLFLFSSSLLLAITSSVFAQQLPSTTKPMVLPWGTVAPPAGSYNPRMLILKFREGALDYSQLCFNCDTIVPTTISKDADETAWYGSCTATVLAQHLPATIILDEAARTVFESHGLAYLKRMTAASPCSDTIGISRLGDTLREDSYNWMTATFDNDTSLTEVVTALYHAYDGSLSSISFNGYIQIGPPSSGKPSIGSYTVTENPFVDELELHFELTDYVGASLQIYDVLGKVVWELPTTQFSIGAYMAFIDGALLPQGILFARLSLENGVSKTIKVIRR